MNSSLWLLLIALVAAILTMEIAQSRALKRLGAETPRMLVVLRVMNLLLLGAILAYVAWAVLLRGR